MKIRILIMFFTCVWSLVNGQIASFQMLDTQGDHVQNARVYYGNELLGLSDTAGSLVDNLLALTKFVEQLEYYTPVKNKGLDFEAIITQNINRFVNTKNVQNELRVLAKELGVEVYFNEDSILGINREKGYVSNVYGHPEGKLFFKSVILQWIVNISQPFKRKIVKAEFPGFRKVSILDFYILFPKSFEVKYKISNTLYTCSPEEELIGSFLYYTMVMKKSYPNLNDVIVWEKKTREGIQSILTTPSRRNLIEQIKRSSHLLKDGHFKLKDLKAKSEFTVPIRLNILNGKVLIKRIDQKKDSLSRLLGAEVLKIDDVDIHGFMDKNLIYYSYSNEEFGKQQCLNDMLKGEKGDSIKLTYRYNRKLDSIKLCCNLFNTYYPWHDNLVATQEFNDSILYINTAYIGFSELKKEIDRINLSYAGLVLDLRGYMKDVNVIKCFTTEEVKSPVLKTPYYVSNSNKVIFTNQQWKIVPYKKQIKIPIIVLMDYNSFSKTETALSIIKDNKLATIVGENSCGANGNVNGLTLKSALFIVYTGQRVVNYFGRPIIQEGIKPDVDIYKASCNLETNSLSKQAISIFKGI